MQGAIWRRSRFLVRYLVGVLVDEDPEPVRLPDLVGAMEEVIGPEGRPRWSRKTVENAVRDLAAFGAIRVTERGRDRVATLTIMGLAWRAGIPMPSLENFRDIEATYDEIADWFGDATVEDLIDEAVLAETEDWAPELTDEQMAELVLHPSGFVDYDRARRDVEEQRAAVVAEVEREAEKIAAALSEHLPEGYEVGFDSSPLE